MIELRIKIRERWIYPITTPKGQEHYYKFLDYWENSLYSDNRRIKPTIEDAIEYRKLANEEDVLKESNSVEAHKKLQQLKDYETKYDWRPYLEGTEGAYGLYAPDGKQLLPNKYHDIFRQFETYTYDPLFFIPVYSGQHWGLVTFDENQKPVLDFRYDKIIVERWNKTSFFVQDSVSHKWGVYRCKFKIMKTFHYGNNRTSFPILEPYTLCDFDEIFEDKLIVDDVEFPFFVLLKGDKIGILNEYGVTEIIYDSYEADDNHFLIILHSIGDDIKFIDYYNPCCVPYS